jgi:hypothetical protein
VPFRHLDVRSADGRHLLEVTGLPDDPARCPSWCCRRARC